MIFDQDIEIRHDIARVLGFWFAPGMEDLWFVASEQFDRQVAHSLKPFYLKARSKQLESWTQDPRGCLALVILLDQVPRNILRGTKEAFATDAQALAITKEAVHQGFARALSERERLFLYLPLEHSEDLENQNLSVRLFRGLTSEPQWLHYAEKHRDIIVRFGRFPHRNKILDRESIAEEIAFLATPNSSF